VDTIPLYASEIILGEKRVDLSRELRPEDYRGLAQVNGEWKDHLVRYRGAYAELAEHKRFDRVVVHDRDIADKCELFGDDKAAYLFLDYPELFQETEEGYYRLALCAHCDSPVDQNAISLLVPYGCTKWRSDLGARALFCGPKCLADFEREDDCDGKELRSTCPECNEFLGQSFAVYLSENGGAPIHLCSSKCVASFADKFAQ